MKNIKNLTDEELTQLLESIIEHEDSGRTKRAELLVPMATELKNNIGSDYTLREALEEIQNGILVETAKRYIHKNKHEKISRKTTKKHLLDAFLLYLDDSLPDFTCDKIEKEGNWNCSRCDVCMLKQYLDKAKKGERPKVAWQNDGRNYPKL